jgi:hypothetical protein
VEGAGELPEVARLAQRHKHAFRDRLVATAAEAGAADPESLGRQLAVIFEGANALAASSNHVERSPMPGEPPRRSWTWP